MKSCKTLLPLICVLLLIMVLCLGCAEEPVTYNINYKTFVMPADDIRFRWTNFPLFSFEYPEQFAACASGNEYDQVINYNRVDICFIDVFHFLSPNLIVSIIEPWMDHYENANEYANDWTPQPENFTGDIVKEKVMIVGIEADYVELWYIPSHSGGQEKERTVFFDYAGLIWQIWMSTYSGDPEPPEVQASFNHILDTFAFIDQHFDTNHPSSELDVTVEYDSETQTFSITNNEEYVLFNVKLYLNYYRLDLSRGYKSCSAIEIYSNETIYIWLRDFMDSDDEFLSEGEIKPFKLTVKAKFPGSVGKVYTCLKTWD